MIYRPSVDEKFCFVLLPLKEPFLGYYQEIIKPVAKEAGLETLHAGEIYGTNAIIRDVWESIWRARLIVADVSGKNPNVNYELGLCHALGVPTILLSNDIEDVPFDYRHRRCIIYETRSAKWTSNLRSDLKNTLDSILADPSQNDDLTWPYDTFELATPKSARALMTPHDQRAIVIQGAGLVAAAISTSFGPLGKFISVFRGNYQIPVRRGFDIATGLKSSNPLESVGIESMRLCAKQMAELIGDATKTAILLAHGILQSSHESSTPELSEKDVVHGMETACRAAIAHIRRQAKPMDNDKLRHIATTAAGSEVGEIVSQAFERIGQDGFVSVIGNGEASTELEILEGLRFDSPYLSETFITDPYRRECVLVDARIFISDRRISTMRELIPLLEQAAAAKQPLLIIAHDVDGEALATLIVNKIKGTLLCAAVKAPVLDRKGFLEDVAVITGGKAFTQELAVPLEEIHVRDLGRATRIIIDSENTTIFEGSGSPDAVRDRVNLIKTLIPQTKDPNVQYRLRSRLANLLGKVAVVKVGATTDQELRERSYRVWAAVNAIRSAFKEGWVEGGGLSLLRAARQLNALNSNNAAEASGIQTIARALELPTVKLIESCGRSATSVLAELREREFAQGFNLNTGLQADLASCGVIDAAETMMTAVRIALSHARTTLQTASWDFQAPKVSEEPFFGNEPRA